MVWAMLVFSWIWSLVLSLPPLLGWGSFKPGKKYFRNLGNYLFSSPNLGNNLLIYLISKEILEQKTLKGLPILQITPISYQEMRKTGFLLNIFVSETFQQIN